MVASRQTERWRITSGGDLQTLRRVEDVWDMTLGFTTRQITNAYRVHEPASGLGLIAMTLFATESNSWTASEAKFSFKNAMERFQPRLHRICSSPSDALPNGK